MAENNVIIVPFFTFKTTTMADTISDRDLVKKLLTSIQKNLLLINNFLTRCLSENNLRMGILLSFSQVSCFEPLANLIRSKGNIKEKLPKSRGFDKNPPFNPLKSRDSLPRLRPLMMSQSAAPPKLMNDFKSSMHVVMRYFLVPVMNTLVQTMYMKSSYAMERAE